MIFLDVICKALPDDMRSMKTLNELNVDRHGFWTETETFLKYFVTRAKFSKKKKHSGMLKQEWMTLKS
jgi:hypothetical protein